MKKLNMLTAESVTFAEGCTKYLDNCRQRNLREGTINHYKQSYVQFAKFFDMNMPVENITSDMYKKYVVYLRSTLQNDVSINSYLRDLITTLHFLMNEGYVAPFKSKPSRLTEPTWKHIRMKNSASYYRSPISRNVVLLSISHG